MSGVLILEERGGGGLGLEEAPPPEGGRPRWGGCAMWTRQQTWLCVVPLLIGLVGLGLSLMLLQWIVVGSVQDYVPTDLVDAKGMGQDPIFLSKPSSAPKGSGTSTAAESSTVSFTMGTMTVSQAPHLHNRVAVWTTIGPDSTSKVARPVTPRSTARRPSTRTPSPLPMPSASSKPALPERSREHPTRQPAVTPRPHAHPKTLTPTSPLLRSEHFKPCRDKDLTYCLNDGECFVIETLTGSHKHCRCKEGYQGVRCDQFLPKTDSILSDPTDNLGIEFMESKETYPRQVLSIISIAVGISLLAVVCMALYCRNRNHGEKIQAHLKECRSLRRNTVSHRPTCAPQCKRSSSTSAPLCKKVLQASHPAHTGRLPSPHQKILPESKQTSSNAPPGRLYPTGNRRDGNPTYQHLQEVQSTERGESMERTCSLREDAHSGGGINMQSCIAAAEKGGGTDINMRSHTPLLSFRTCSIPIIPSVQGGSDSCSSYLLCPGSSHGLAVTECKQQGGSAEHKSKPTQLKSSTDCVPLLTGTGSVGGIRTSGSQFSQ